MATAEKDRLVTPESEIVLASGNRMPVMGLGTWQLTHDTAATVEAAIALGYRMIDTSGDYGTQPGIGKAIRSSGVARDRLYLVTKVEETENGYESSRRNVETLGIGRADLILIHRPPAEGAGVDLWEGLIRARDDGVTRDIGVSNYSTALIDDLIAATGETPAVNQIEWSPFGHSEAMARHAAERNIVIQAYSPLTRTTRLKADPLRRIAASYGKTPAQILIRWNLQHGTVPIPKANRRRHLEEDIDVFDFEIGDEDMAMLDGLNQHYSSLGTLPYE